jgi:hypothetical protein
MSARRHLSSVSLSAGSSQNTTVIADSAMDTAMDNNQAGTARPRALMSRSALRPADDAIALATFQDLTEELWANEH